MIMKCTMASISAGTDRTLGKMLSFPPLEISDNCFKEILVVAKSKGYELGDEYVRTAADYLERAGAHKDSICPDIAGKAPTEVDFLGEKVVECVRELENDISYYPARTNLAKTIEGGICRGKR